MADDLYIQIGSNANEVQRDIVGLSRSLNKLFSSISQSSSMAAKNIGSLGDRILDVSKAAERSRGFIDLTPMANSARLAAAEVQRVNKNINDLTSPALRYALYDVGSSLRTIALGLAAFPIATTGFAIKYERDFANVIRTNQLASDSLATTRQELLNNLRDIAQASPIDWSEITQIATLAGQLGIATESTASFTDTVAKFAATTDLSVQAAATAFGRLDQLITGVDGKFENLGSAILAVGVDSVATESQIVAVSTQIASMGNLANLSAADIVGLSGALASLGIQPELARGTITRLFSEIGASIAEGGFALTEFGRLTGRTADEFANAWSSEPTEVLLDFFEGIKNEGPAAERTLRNIGISSVRDIPAILRLAQSQDEVRRLIALSNEEFILGQKVNEQYGIISTTTAEQIRRLTQNIESLLAAFGGLIGPVSGIVGILNGLVEVVTDFINTDVGQVIGAIAGTAALVLAAFVGLAAASATALAGLIALRFATKDLGIDLSALTFNAITSGKALDALGLSALRANTTVAFLTKSIGFLSRFLLIASSALIVLGLGWDLYTKRGENVKKIQGEILGNQEKLNEALDKDFADFINTKGKSALRTFTVELENANDETRKSVRDGIDYVSGQEKVAESTSKGSRAMEEQAQKAQLLSERYVVLGKNFADYVKTQATQSASLVTAFQNQQLQQIVTSEFGGFESFVDLAIGNPDEARARLLAIQSEIDTVVARNPSTLAGAGLVSEETRNASRDLLEVLIPLVDAIAEGSYVGDAWADSLGFISEGTEEVEYRTALANGEVERLIETIFGEANAAKAATDATQEFFASLADGTNTLELTDEGLQNMIASIAGNEFRTIEERIADLNFILLLLEQQGYGSTAMALALKLAIVELGSAAGVEGINIDNFRAKIASLISGISSLPGLTGAAENGLAGVGTAARSAGGAVETLADKFNKLLDSIFDPVNLARDAAQSISNLGESYAELGDDAFYASKEIQGAVSSILESSKSPAEGVANLNALYARLAQTVGSSTAPSLAFLRNTIDQVARSFGIASNTVAGATINLDFFNMGIKSAQKEVRTLTDYANDLEEVISRAFDLRFARTLEVDRIAEAWEDLSSTIEDARFQVDELLASQRDLGADRSLKEYFLSVAEAYGDTLRAAQLRKEIAELSRQEARGARELAEAQAIAGGDLSGQGAGQRQNRQALLDLLQQYQGYITTLAETGASQKELKDATAEARREFIDQATELGFQESIVLQYAAAFDDVQTAISRVERNITVDANVNPALQALNELNAKLNDSIDLARELNRIQGTPVPTQTIRTQIVTQVVPVGDRFRSENLRFQRLQRPAFGGTGFGGFYSGGFTGPGGMYDPAGIVHKGEYVIPKRYVNQSTGLPDPSFLAQLQSGMRNFAVGGSASGSAQTQGGAIMVELSPFDRKLLSDAGNVQLRLNNKVIAEATNRANLIDAQRGTN